MTPKEIKPNIRVRNIKHNIIEEIIDTCKLRQSDGTWVDGVAYRGKDRFTGATMIFCRKINSFCEDFELMDTHEKKTTTTEDTEEAQQGCNN